MLPSQQTQMKLKRVFSFAIAGGALAALIAGATTTGYRRPPQAPARDKRAGKSDLSGAALAVEIQRLHERLRPSIPADRIVVAESGIRNGADIARLRDAGVDAILVGETLMRAHDPAAVLRGLLAG